MHIPTGSWNGISIFRLWLTDGLLHLSSRNSGLRGSTFHIAVSVFRPEACCLLWSKVMVSRHPCVELVLPANHATQSGSSVMQAKGNRAGIAVCEKSAVS